MIDSQSDRKRPLAILREREADIDSGTADVLTVFLTAATCPIGCTMCDLHRATHADPTKRGDIPEQIRSAFREKGTQHDDRHTVADTIKLYNSGNFFDPHSIPRSDHREIGDLVSGFRRVVIENHPRFGCQQHATFRDLIDGRLEVAVGLETVQPRWLRRMNKQMSRDDFDRYAFWLSREKMDLRVFIIFGVPGISANEAERWTRLSIRHSIHAGARHVSVIPARRGNGWDGRSHALPEIGLLRLESLQCEAIDRYAGVASVTIDLWDTRCDDEDSSDAAVMQRIRRRNEFQNR